MRRWGFFLPVLFCCLPLCAQSASVPLLHHRREQRRSGTAQQAKIPSHSRSTLPEDAFGEYEWGRRGDVIEIALDGGGLSGYISRFGDSESDNGTPLTFFFDRVSARERQVGFTTRQIHGIWYAFEGTIVRGPGLDRGDEGFYLLQGTLTTHDAARGTETQQAVRLKSEPEFQ